MDLYTDNEPFVCRWMEELIAQKHLPPGAVNETCIKELEAKDLDGFERVHFFAGIGGWAYALELAGWPRGYPVWTGSCPCQPFSAAGKRKGEEDSRHVWPDWFRLIRQCRPAIIFGEQVSSDDGYRWLAGVFADLEAEGYSVGAADLPACGVGAPHRRYRLYWVAYAGGTQRKGLPEREATSNTIGRRCRKRFRRNGPLVNPQSAARQPDNGAIHEVQEPIRQDGANELASAVPGSAGGLDDAASAVREGCDAELSPRGQAQGRFADRPGAWSDSIAIQCRDGKYRRISPKPALFPLSSRLPGRMGMLRGAGNSIVPQVATTFIKAFMSHWQDDTEICN